MVKMFSLDHKKEKLAMCFRTTISTLKYQENICFNLDNKYNKNFSKIIELTNLNNLIERYPHEISGGEQQKHVSTGNPSYWMSPLVI